MKEAVCSIITFPPISWWAMVSLYEEIIYERFAHFDKSLHCNRYEIAGANDVVKLSLPLLYGRDQRAVISEIKLSTDANWQVQHWRTITSAYRRSPYFEHFEHSLKNIFDTHFTYLADFNLTSIHWLKEQLRLNFNERSTDEYVKDYSREVVDMRGYKKKGKEDYPTYYQLFSDRTGFLPDMSMLDLLFSEGPYAMDWINKHRDKLL